MTTPTLPELAQAVAEALGLDRMSPTGSWIEPYAVETPDNGIVLACDGSNVFDSWWQVRGRDWLLEQGCSLEFQDSNVHFCWASGAGNGPAIRINCPASEFAARAIFALRSKND